MSHFLCRPKRIHAKILCAACRRVRIPPKSKAAGQLLRVRRSRAAVAELDWIRQRITEEARAQAGPALRQGTTPHGAVTSRHDSAVHGPPGSSGQSRQRSVDVEHAAALSIIAHTAAAYSKLEASTSSTKLSEQPEQVPLSTTTPRPRPKPEDAALKQTNRRAAIVDNVLREAPDQESAIWFFGGQ